MASEPIESESEAHLQGEVEDLESRLQEARQRLDAVQLSRRKQDAKPLISRTYTTLAYVAALHTPTDLTIHVLQRPLALLSISSCSYPTRPSLSDHLPSAAVWSLTSRTPNQPAARPSPAFSPRPSHPTPPPHFPLYLPLTAAHPFCRISTTTMTPP